MKTFLGDFESADLRQITSWMTETELKLDNKPINPCEVSFYVATTLPNNISRHCSYTKYQGIQLEILNRGILNSKD